jgi:hypothetical protein
VNFTNLLRVLCIAEYSYTAKRIHVVRHKFVFFSIFCDLIANCHSFQSTRIFNSYSQHPYSWGCYGFVRGVFSPQYFPLTFTSNLSDFCLPKLREHFPLDFVFLPAVNLVRAASLVVKDISEVSGFPEINGQVASRRCTRPSTAPCSRCVATPPGASIVYHS